MIIIKIKCNVFVLKWSVCVFFWSFHNALFKEGITLETFNLTPDDLSICTYKSSQNSNICKLNHKFVDEKESQTWFSCIVKLVSAGFYVTLILKIRTLNINIDFAKHVLDVNASKPCCILRANILTKKLNIYIKKFVW